MAVATARLGEAPERYFALPSLGLAWLVGAALAPLVAAGGWRRRAALLVAGVAAAAGVVAVSLRLPDWRGDLPLFEAALRVDPDDALGTLRLGLEAMRQGRPAEALARLERGAAAHPEEPRLWNALAVLQLRRGDGPAALAAARRAVALAPRHPQSRLHLATALHLAGDHAAELEEAERAVSLSPAFREARITRALARCEVAGAACEADLDRLEQDGALAGADLMVARAEAAIRRRDGALATARVARLEASFPADPRLRVLVPAAARLGAR
jgi:tetratricopeptide (TPR) repeat protein